MSDLSSAGVGTGLRTRSGMMNGVGDLSSPLNAGRFDVGTGVRTTLRWREPDSNFRYRGRRPACGRSLRAQRVETDPAKREFGSDSCLLAPPCGGSGGLGGGLCFPFPTPEDGQQESRLAPIGRHLVRL